MTELATFPLFAIKDGRCTCHREDCRDAGKHPKVAKWREYSGFVPAPGEGYGIATGSRSGVFVVDLDGDDAVRHMQSLGPLPPTYAVRTGRDELGVHLYFKMPADGTEIRNDRGRKLGHCKIDVRGEGGFVVGPGSPHASGRTYTVIDNSPPAEAPAWLLDRLSQDASERRAAAAWAPKPIDLDTAEGARRVELAYEYLDQRAEPSLQGQGGSGAFWNVAQTLIRTYELPIDAAAQLVQEVYNPRCSPPWSDREIWHKLEDARDVGTWMCGCASAEFPDNLWKASQKPVRAPIAVSTRKVKQANHRYTFTPGDRPNGEKKKISFANAIADLVTHQEWEGVLQWDEFRRRAYAVDPPMQMDAEQIGGLSKKDGLRIAAWFEVNGSALIVAQAAHQAALMASHHNSYHPVKEYLTGCGEKVTGILDTLAEKVLGAKDPQANEFLKKTLVAAVRRIRKPGCQMDTVLVLYGPQGVRKTTFVRELFGPEFVRSQMPDLATKDASQALGGFWAIELAELARIVNSESSTVKEFLTRTFDDYRPPYGDVEMRFARECVLIGTTNDREFLSDATGNRRYLPIEVTGQIDLDYLALHRDEIWAEACALETAGYAHWYTDDSKLETSRESFIREDVWHDIIEEYIKGRVEVSVNDVLKEALAGGTVDLLKVSRKEQMRVADTLKRLGCRAFSTGRKRKWEVPQALQTAAPSKKTAHLRLLAGKA